jgi:hypothetical protein
MVDKKYLFAMVDELSTDDLEELYQHIRQRRQIVALHTATGTHQAVTDSPQHEPADTIRHEVNAIIDETLTQVRRKRETQEIAKV